MHLRTLTLESLSQWQWILIALAAGLLLAYLPLSSAVVLAGVVILGVVVLVEPALLFVVMLSAAPLKALMETENVLALPVDIGQILFVLAVGVWAISKMARREPFWLARQPSLVYWPVLLFLGVTAFTLPAAYSLSAGLNEWLKWVEILLLIFIVVDFGPARWEWFLFGVIFAGAVQALLGLYTFAGGSGAPHLWILDFQYFRAFGSFGQPNPFGAFMGLVLPLAIGSSWGYIRGAWQKRQLGEQWQDTALVALAYGMMTIIILSALLASWSRGTWMGFAVAALILIWLAPRRLWTGTLAVAMVGLVAGGLWLAGLIPQSIVERVVSFSEDFTGFGDMRGVVISDENYPVVERLAHWQSALDMAESRPVLGVGIGNYEAAYPDFALVNWPDALGHAHNYYLNLLAETGIAGLIAYLIMGTAIFSLTWRTLRQTDAPVERGVALGLFGVWTHLTVHSLVDKLYVNNMFLHVGIMLGILAVLWQRKSSIVEENIV